MEKFVKYFMIIMMAFTVTFVSCSDDDDDNGNPTTPTTTTYDLLVDYMISHDMDVATVFDGWITSAEAVATKSTDEWHIIDIRAQADYDAGHIEGAIPSTLGGILDAAASASKSILV